jgi:hypothetical protein
MALRPNYDSYHLEIRNHLLGNSVQLEEKFSFATILFYLILSNSPY